MKHNINNGLSAIDQRLVQQEIKDFLPCEIYDIHAHLVTPAANLPPYLNDRERGFEAYQAALKRWLPAKKVHVLAFGFPSRDNDRGVLNQWIKKEIQQQSKDGLHRALALTSPEDNPELTEELLSKGGFVGIKPYHVYAPLADTTQAGVEDFAPEWMWDLCHSHQGILMLHIMKNGAISDPDNISTLRRLCRKYPRCRLVLPHVARSFSYRAARKGLQSLSDLDNVWVDTSAITETETIRRALEVLGPERVLFGSDYPISELRGRCVATGEFFSWFHPGDGKSESKEDDQSRMTLIGIESLLCLREAVEDCGLGSADVQNIFFNNAVNLLEPHLQRPKPAPTHSGPELWSEAKTKISCGTGLRSKWAELYDPASWPSYFSRCSGSEIWDVNNRRYVDFGAGAGAIVLGYSDPDVNRAVKRRVDNGSYCQLVSPDETALADLLLELHPWAQRVRYARGGGEALSVAVRIARAATGKSGVAFCGYHGWQDWYLAANLADQSSLDGHLLPGLQPLGVPRELSGTAVPFRFNDWPSFEASMERLDGRLAAVVMEPMRTQFPQDQFLAKVATRCREIGAVFILDEVTSGWRFGFPGAHTVLGTDPDIAVYAKAMSNGFPCAAIIGRENVMDAANSSFISSSYWTDGVGPAASLACIRKMRAVNAQSQIWGLGEKMQKGLSSLAGRHKSLKMKSWGLPSNPYMTFDLGDNALPLKTLIVRKMLSRGFMSTGSASFIMLTHTEKTINDYLEALDSVLGELNDLAVSGRIQSETGNVKAMAGFARLT